VRRQEVVKRRLMIIVLVLLALPAIALMNPGRSLGGPIIPSYGGSPEPGTGNFEVPDYLIRVIDAQTLELYASGTRFGVGIIGIDAPQPNTDCGVAGTNFLSGLVRGQVTFEEDPDIFFARESLRMYHVRSNDNTTFAHELVRNGFAYSNGEGLYAQELAELQADAERSGVGCLWGAEIPDRQQQPEPDVAFDPGIAGIGTTSVPIDFEEQVVVGGLTYPTSFAFLPSGDILIGENSGVVRLYSNGQLLSTPFIDISDQVNDYWDRGLISIAVDPDFESNGYVYLYFTYENDSSDYVGPKTGRLIRVTSSGETASISTQVTLLGSIVGSSCNSFPASADCIPSDAPSHSGGDIRFASDGSLFATIGDGANFHTVTSDALRAQDPDALAGKIVRINPGSGQGLPENPFWDGNPHSNNSKIWGSGLRNAFRFGIQPGTNIPFVGDVGWSTAEEINVAVPGANMGWPCYEGSSQQNGYSSFPVCQDLYAQGSSAVQPPLIEWPHSGGGAAATSGVFYTATNYPVEFQNAYFYADYVQSWIRYVQVNEEQQITAGPFDFATGADGPVDFEMGSDGNLYYLAINTGEVRRIVHSSSGTDPPPPPPPSDEMVYLSDIDWVEATNGWGPVERDASNGEDAPGDGQALAIQDATYLKGLGVHAFSDITFALGASCHTFLTDIGIDEEVGENGSVIFEVWVDGGLAFQSGILTGADPAQHVEVDITAAEELRLVVSDGGDNVWWDHANWADARLLCGNVEEPPPPPPPPLSVVSVSPEDGTAEVPVGTAAAAEFSLPLLLESVSSATIWITDSTDGSTLGSTIDLNENLSVIEITPVSDLRFSTTYHVTILGGEEGIRSAEDTILESSYSWTFTTEDEIQDPDPPIVPLTILSSSPSDGSVDVPTEVVISAEFSRAIDQSTLTLATMYLEVTGGGAPIEASIGYDEAGRIASLAPVSALDFSTEYTVVVAGGEAGVLSDDGSAMSESYSWSFTTEAEEPPPPEPALLSPATYYPAGTHAHSAHAEDLNGDGAPDLVVANAGDNTISVLFGNGDGTFDAPVNYGVGAEPKNAVTGDFNADGLLDIVAANQASNDVSVLLANGPGTYDSAVGYSTCVGAHEVKVADLNNNGILDLAVACWGGSVMNVLLGNGDGTFQEAITFDVGSNPHALVIGDLNGNGIQDIAVANNGSANVSVLIGNSDGTFAAATAYSAGAGPHSIDIGDFSGDGNLDLVTANDGSDSVSIFLGNGDGTFQPQVMYSVGEMPKGVRVADLTADGILDIVTANTFGNYGSPTPVDTSISVLRGVGDGTFETAESFEVNQTPFGVALADFNGDGKIDVAAASWHSGNVGVLLNE
jgi:glucose/arabinose dehydrogenase